MRRVKQIGLLVCFLMSGVFLSACSGRVEVERPGVVEESLPEMEQVDEVVFVCDYASLKKKLMETTLEIHAGDEVVCRTFGELGIVLHDEEEFLDKYGAMLRRPGSILVRGLELNSYSVRLMVEELADKYDVTVLEPEFSGFEERAPIWDEGEHGRNVIIEHTLSLVKSAVSSFSGADIVINAVVVECEPRFCAEELNLCNEVLGECLVPCDFATASGRNALRSMELLHGTVFMPGEEVSVKKLLEPFSEENGYENSTGFINGYVVDSIGGGVCRVATAMYGAFLYADLTVLERHCHTKQVSYASVSMDATISSEKDLVVRNDFSVPVVVSAESVAEGILIRLIGRNEHVADSCTVGFFVQVTDVVLQGPDEVFISDEVPFMEYRIVEPGAPGCRAVLYREVYDEEGGLISSRKVNESFYLPRSSSVIAGRYYE